MFVAMNQFRIRPGQEATFERIWRERESHLRVVPGFVHFALLRGDEPGEYVSHSTWASRDAFRAWTESEAFVRGHRQAGALKDVVAGPATLRLYEAVIEESPGEAAATA